MAGPRVRVGRRPARRHQQLRLSIPCCRVDQDLEAGLAYAGSSTIKRASPVGRVAGKGLCWRASSRALRAPARCGIDVALRMPMHPRLKPLVGSGWSAKLRGWLGCLLACCHRGLGVLLDHRPCGFSPPGPFLSGCRGAITDPVGRPLFPLNLPLYRGEPVPFVAGNAMAHAEAVARCRDLLGSAHSRA
jgi:hypothetical protein